MTEAYCVRCRTKKEMVDAEEQRMSGHAFWLKGRCADCGTVMFRRVSDG